MYGALDNTPINPNFLSPLNFRFHVKKLPHVNWFVQQVNVPQILSTPPDTTNPMVNFGVTADHLQYSPLEVTFAVDEDLKNYLEVHNWIKGETFPQYSEQYKDLQDKPPMSGEGLYSDMTIIIQSSAKIANYEINFTDGFPISLGGFTLQTTDKSVKYLTAKATFKYTNYDIVKI